MICHCGRKMFIARDDVLKVSGMRRQMYRCNSWHSFTLLEGMPVADRQKDGCRYECASNARAAIFKPLPEKKSTVLRNTALPAVCTAPSVLPDPIPSPVIAKNLLMPIWGLPKVGANGLQGKSSGSRVGSNHQKNHHGDAIAVASEREAA